MGSCHAKQFATLMPLTLVSGCAAKDGQVRLGFQRFCNNLNGMCTGPAKGAKGGKAPDVACGWSLRTFEPFER